MKPVRMRVGVAKFPDGWNVVVEGMPGGTQVYDPAFPTEDEAMAKAADVSTLLRSTLNDAGIPFRPAEGES